MEPIVQNFKVKVNLPRIRENVQAIAKKTGVPILAVVKSNAYGLGIDRVAPAILDLVEGFCVFSLAEADAANLFKLAGKPAIAIGPPDSNDPRDYLTQNVRPAVSNVDQATTLRDAKPILSIDTGMQRFACPPAEIEATLAAGDIKEAFTHAVRLEQIDRLLELTHGKHLKLHATGTKLLHEPRAWLSATRPGLAMYDNAVKISAPLIEVHDSSGPAGYTGFKVARHGVILAGYTSGVRVGPARINGRATKILEVGMQSAFVEIDKNDHLGDEVFLIDDVQSAHDLAAAWNVSPQEALCTLASRAEKTYRA